MSLSRLLDIIRYKFLKARCQRILRSADPIAAVNFAFFIEFELDKIYEKEGYAKAKEAVEAWPAQMTKKIDKIFSKIMKPRKCSWTIYCVGDKRWDMSGTGESICGGIPEEAKLAIKQKEEELGEPSPKNLSGFLLYENEMETPER